MKLSGENWVGNLYQKFEAVCHEVDGLVSQEHIKNLENHVQSVGDNVMKLCSNVKDLLPSSLGGPVELKAKSEIGVMCDFESESGDVDCVADARQISPEMDVADSLRSNQTHDQVSDEDLLETRVSKEPSSSSSELPSGQSDISVISDDCDEEKQSSEVSERVCPESSLIDQKSQNSDSFTEEKQTTCCGSELTHSESSLISLNSGLVTKEGAESPSDFQKSVFPDEHLCERAITVFHNQNHPLVDPVPEPGLHLKEEVLCDSIHKFSLGSEVFPKEDMVSDNPDRNSAASADLASLELSDHCEADFFLSKIHTSNWSVIENGTPSKEKAEDIDSGSLASTDFPNDEGVKPKQMEFSVRFEGSCVFVETDGIHADSCAPERAHPRKKKVKCSFSSRKKRVKEYKQLALWYGDIDAEFDDGSRQKLNPPSHNKHLSSQGVQESERELL